MWKHARCGYQNGMGKFERVFGFLFGWLVGFLVTEVAPRPSRLGGGFGKYRCPPPNQGARLFLWKVQGTRNSVCVFFQQLHWALTMRQACTWCGRDNMKETLPSGLQPLVHFRFCRCGFRLIRPTGLPAPNSRTWASRTSDLWNSSMTHSH